MTVLSRWAAAEATNTAQAPPTGIRIRSDLAAARREVYAGDQGANSLVAVTPRTNRSKVTQDSSGLIPPSPEAQSRYVGEWAWNSPRHRRGRGCDVVRQAYIVTFGCGNWISNLRCRQALRRADVKRQIGLTPRGALRLPGARPRALGAGQLPKGYAPCCRAVYLRRVIWRGSVWTRRETRPWPHPRRGRPQQSVAVDRFSISRSGPAGADHGANTRGRNPSGQVRLEAEPCGEARYLAPLDDLV